MRIATLVALALTTFTVEGAPPPSPADPVTLLGGRTSGVGHLRILLGAPKPFRVESDGRVQPDGAFRLDQRVMIEGEPARSRHWIVRRVGTGRHAFTLSDAVGPGTAVVERGRLTLRYRLPRGVHVRQVLVPSADGRTIANTGSIRWLGLPIGRLEETITRAVEGVDGRRDAVMRDAAVDATRVGAPGIPNASD